MNNYRRMNVLFDEMMEDVTYSKIAAFTGTLHMREIIGKKIV